MDKNNSMQPTKIRSDDVEAVLDRYRTGEIKQKNVRYVRGKNTRVLSGTIYSHGKLELSGKLKRKAN